MAAQPGQAQPVEAQPVEQWRGMGKEGGDNEITRGSLLRTSNRHLLFGLLRPQRRGLALMCVLSIAQNAAGLLGPYLVKVGIDSGIPSLATHQDAAPIIAVLVALCVAAVAQAGLDFWSAIVLGRVGQNVLFALRRQVFDHVQSLGLAFAERFTSGRIISRLTSDIEALEELLTNGLQSLVWALLTMGTTVVMLFVIDWQLALVAVAFVPIFIAITVWFRRNSFLSYRKSREIIALIIIHFVDSLRGIAAVQAFRREQRNEEIFGSLNQQYQLVKQRSTRLLAVYGPGVKGLGNLLTATALLVGGLQVLHGRITVGVLAAFLLYLQRALEPLLDLSQFYDSLQSSSAALEKLSNLLKETPTIAEIAQPVVLAECRGEVTFHHVHFGYNDHTVIPDLHLAIPAGQTVALVGATGAGKSTIVKLLARMYDPLSGAVRLDGVDLRELSIATLRANIAVVTQENFLFSRSVADNISFGRPGASPVEIKTVAAAIGADAFITALPHGFDTEVGKRGAQLSAGQRQLLSFARALLADPRVLVLDEATSSLDIPSERLVQQALRVLLADRTALVIAHRLSTVEIADRVIVLDGGRVVEDGSPAELIANSRYYRRLHEAWQESLM